MLEVLLRVRNAMNNERLLSTFEISVSNIVPSLLVFLKAIVEENSNILAECFLKVILFIALKNF